MPYTSIIFNLLVLFVIYNKWTQEFVYENTYVRKYENSRWSGLSLVLTY